ncbi:MAG: hypothetical protein E7254_05595 [Lachnospiraceae bacterium]|nr:hypothetical protein [Lachnospiraceae bacterium]
MYKYIKKTLSVVLVAAVTFTSVSFTDGIGMKNVYAVSNIEKWENKEEAVVDSTMIPDVNLLAELSKILGNNFKAKALKEYTGTIDLSGKSNIYDVTGLGYAINAKSINLSGTGVTVINKNEFLACNFESVVLPDGLVEIGDYAFSLCSNLKNINFPNTLKRIKIGAFEKCTSLRNVTFPDSVEHIGNDAFANCQSMTSIALPKNIKGKDEIAQNDSNVGIGANVFMGCTSVTNVTFGDVLTKIPEGLLKGCTSLSSVTIPERIVAIGAAAFSGTGLESINLSKNHKLEELSDTVFGNCVYLSSIALPDELKVIGSRAFENCISLEDLSQISNCSVLEEIGMLAFAGSGLKYAYIPVNVRNIGAKAFYECTALKTLKFEEFPDELDAVLCKKIGESAFEKCTNLQKINFPLYSEGNANHTIEIGIKAFSQCMNLDEDIYFPDNISLIDDHAFFKCGLSTTNWDDNVGPSMRAYYIASENDIKTGPNGGKPTAETIFTTAREDFYQPAIGYIDWADLSTVKTADKSVEIYVKVTSHGDLTAEELAKNYNKETKMYVQDVVGIRSLDFRHLSKTKFGVGVFEQCINLRDVRLPDELTVIPEAMFKDTSCDIIMGNGKKVSSLAKLSATEEWYYGLERVYMSPYVTDIGVSAFQNAHRLTLDSLPSTVEYVRNYAFDGVENFRSVVFGSKLKGIGDYAFRNTSRLADNFAVENKGLLDVDVTNASNLEYIGTGAFYKSALKRFQLNENAPIQVIKSQTFAQCQKLEDFAVSNSVRKIYSEAFGATCSLLSFKVKDITNVDVKAFYGSFTSSHYREGASCLAPKQSPNTSNKYMYLSKIGKTNYSVSLLNEKQTIRENTLYTLPFINTCYSSTSNTYINSIMVAGSTFTYKPDTGVLEGNPDEVMITPSIYANTKGDSYKFTNVFSNSTEGYSCPAWQVKLLGKEVCDNIPVNISSSIDFLIYTGTVAPVATSANYKVNVTANPCKEIKLKDCFDDRYNISLADTKGITVTPDFIPTYSDGEITDLPTWEIVSNEDLIEMTVAVGGKSASFKRKEGTSYGTAKVAVTAGSVTKEFYITVCAPPYSLTISETTKGILVGNSDSITATINYKDAYKTDSETYPDAISVSVADESIVTVDSVELLENGSFSIHITGQSAGTTKLTIKCLANAGIKKECTVNVAMDGVKPIIRNAEGIELTNGSVVYMQGKNGVAYNYAFTDNYQGKDLSVASTDSSVLTTTIDAKNGKVTIKPLKKGTAKLTFYPSSGTPENNGVSITFTCEANVKAIKLANKNIALGTTISVFSYMYNDFSNGSSSDKVNRITEANAANYSKITNNKIVFTSSDPSKASVDSFGNVKGLKVTGSGEKITITCTAYNGDEYVTSTTATITVEAPKLESLTYSGKTDITVGENSQIYVLYYPSNCIIEKAVLSNSNSKVVSASVKNVNGKIVVYAKGLTVGTATLKTTVYCAGKSKNISIPVKVSAAKKLAKVKLKKIKAGKKKATLSWTRVAGATGYEIQMSTKKKTGFKKVAKIGSGTKVKYTKKKLKKKKTYYFRVRALAGTNKGAWSKVKSVKIKK